MCCVLLSYKELKQDMTEIMEIVLSKENTIEVYKEILSDCLTYQETLIKENNELRTSIREMMNHIIEQDKKLLAYEE